MGATRSAEHPRASAYRTGGAGPSPRARVAGPEAASALVPRGARCACGGGCPRCGGEPLHLHAAPDAAEREAGRVVEVVGAQPFAPAGVPLPGVGAGGLDPRLRAEMEARFGHDFGDVRIRRDATAEAAAAALGARAFTLAREISFARGEYRPDDPGGRGLVAHELVHVLQQRGPSPLAGAAVVVGHGSPGPARQPTGAAAPQMPPLSPDFATLWRAFQVDMIGPVTPQARERARAVLNAMIATASRQERQTQGLELALWLDRAGMRPEAERAFSDVEGAWLVGAVLRESDVPRSALFTSGFGSTGLISRAEEDARAGRDDDAFRLFGLAYLFLQMQLVQATERRAAELEDPRQAQIADVTRPMFVYPPIEAIYDQMRHILGFYLVLEREATAAGDADRATRMRGLAARLHAHLRDRYSWSGEALLTEVTRVQTQVGPGLRIHGANAAETDVTPFAGQPTPQEIGERSYQWQSLAGIRESLAGQVEFLAELHRHPEIEREFGSREIDMSDVDVRLRVWRTMLGAFRRQGAGPEALAQLMGLIGRYLHAFTIHTQYNIRDWGTNYLTSEMPTDLAGRAERDCGVYALTVAYEVFRTARAASPRLSLDFEITVVPGHVVLVIYDTGSNGFYVVNNDNVSERHAGGRPEAEAAVAPSAAGVFGRRNFVTPGIRMELGSTAMGTTAFRDQAWQRYLQAAGWSLAPEPRSGPGDTRTDAELSEAGARRFYEQQEEFDRTTTRLGGALDALSAALAGQSDADQLASLQARLPRLAEVARRLGALFITLGPAAPIGWTRGAPG